MYTLCMAALPDQVRLAVRTRIECARQEGSAVIDIMSGDIVRELHPKNRTPVVCWVLASKKLRGENHIVLEARQGPPSGQSITTIYTFRLEPAKQSIYKPDAFLALRGVGSGMYASFGGAEAFHKSDREALDK